MTDDGIKILLSVGDKAKNHLSALQRLEAACTIYTGVQLPGGVRRVGFVRRWRRALLVLRTGDFGGGGYHPRRDKWELQLTDGFVKAQKHILGIYRDAQLLNVYFAER